MLTDVRTPFLGTPLVPLFRHLVTYVYVHIYIYIYIYTHLCLFVCLLILLYSPAARKVLAAEAGHRRCCCCASAEVGPTCTANLPNNIVDFRGFDSSVVGGIPSPIGKFLESLIQAMLVGCNVRRQARPVLYVYVWVCMCV